MKSTGLVFKSRDYIGSVEPPATVLEDESRFGNDGTFKADGEPDWTRRPSGLWVMDFDGSDDNVNFGDLTSMNLAPKLTIMSWFKQDILDRDDWLYIKYKDTNNRLQVYTGTSGNLFVQLGLGSNSYGYFDYSVVVTAGEFFHFVMVFDGSGVANADKLKIFIDATQQTLTLVGTIPATTADLSGNDFLLGKATNSFDGQIALPRVWNYALSADQIAAIYQAERHWFGV